MAVAQGHVLLVGGGTVPEEAYAWMVERAPNRQIVVVDYREDALSHPAAFEAAGATATYLPIASRATANRGDVAAQIEAADGIFLPGGDQAQYLALWRSTRTEAAIRAVFDRGGVVGGTSAGAMVLGEVVFAAEQGTVFARESLANPLDVRLTLRDTFLGLLPGVLVETHLYERGRLPRLAALLARYEVDTGRWVQGVGVDDGTALGVGPDGQAEVLGAGVVALLRPAAAPPLREDRRRSLDLRDVPFVQATAGFVLDLTAGTVVEAPASAEPFSAASARWPWVAGFSVGGTVEDWLAPDRLLPQTLRPPVLLFTRANSPVADRLATAWQARGIPLDLILVNEAEAHRADLVAQLEAARLAVFVDNDPAALTAFLDPTRAVGATLRARAAEEDGLATWFLGDDLQVAGAGHVQGTEARQDAAFRGTLTWAPATGLVPETVFMTGLYPEAPPTDYRFQENHLAGWLWGVGQAQAAYGVLVADGAEGVLGSSAGGRAANTQSLSAEPLTLVLDATEATTMARPQRYAGRPARQNLALDRARLSVLFGDVAAFSRDAAAPSSTKESPPGPEGATFSWHPVPTSGRTTLSLVVAAPGPVALDVFDLLGRRVFHADWGWRSTGTHQVVWQMPAEQAAGVYVACVTQRAGRTCARLVLVR
ncbi:MAG: cyanophycinase [Bacteroidota bacterium]